MVMAADIENEFNPQLAMIIDPLIRKKVVEAWSKGCIKGGWKTIEELRELPFTVATDAKGISLLQHTKAATEGAVALAKIQMEKMQNFPRVDMDVLIAGALLHDINKTLVFERDGENGFRKKEGPFEGGSAFPGVTMTRDVGLPEPIVRIVEYECRNALGRPHNVETIIVHHADMITFDTMHYLKNSGVSSHADQSDTKG